MSGQQNYQGDSLVGDNSSGQFGAGPRKVYSAYDKDAYMRDLNAVIREELQKDLDTNPRQKLMMKRSKQVAEDQFKMNPRAINVKKRSDESEEEKGMGLLLMNLDRQKIERDAKRQQYKYELSRQVAPSDAAQRERVC